VTLSVKGDRDVVEVLKVRVRRRIEIRFEAGSVPERPAGKETAFNILAANNSSKDTGYQLQQSASLTCSSCAYCRLTQRRPCVWSM